jgi:hypothetical protein
MNMWIEILGWIEFVIIFIFAIITLFSFIKENNFRAVQRGLFFFLPMLITFAALLLFEFPQKNWIIFSILTLSGIIILIIILPIEKKQSIRLVGEQKRVDERDALFHRFYRLKPGTP